LESSEHANCQRALIAEARQRQAIPVLIIPVSRRSFGPDDKIANNPGDFPELANALVGDLAPFDPSHPNPLEEFKLPPSPRGTAGTPDRN
jgi:hypothetical protein